MEVDSKPFRNWWPVSTEVWTLAPLSAEMPGQGKGDLHIKERHGGKKSLWQNLGAGESNGTVLREAGRALQVQRKQPHWELAGQEVWGKPPPPGLLRCQGWLWIGLRPKYMNIHSWTGWKTLSDCVTLGTSGHHQYLRNTSNGYS